MRYLAMGVLLCLTANTFAEERTARFEGGLAAESALRKTVRVNINPRSAYVATGVIVAIDRARFPKLLREDEVAVLTAAHVADRLGWAREITVQGIDFSGPKGDQKISFSEEFTARLVMLPNQPGPDIALLAASIPKQLFEEGRDQVATRCDLC